MGLNPDLYVFHAGSPAEKGTTWTKWMKVDFLDPTVSSLTHLLTVVSSHCQ